MALLLLLFHLPTLALNATATLVYPLYSSYKAVSSSTSSLADMEVWLVYWSVFACCTLLESLFGFLWSWMPFYYQVRLVFNVWLVAPQTRGATYIYTIHLHPFLQSNQQHIDSLIHHAKLSLRAKLDHTLGALWGASMASVHASQPPTPAPKHARHTPPAPGNAPAPPTQHNPVHAPMSMFANLVKTYAPVAIASARNFLDSKAAPPNTTAAYSIPPSASPNLNHTNRQDALHRRNILESQLAALDTSRAPSTTSSSSNQSEHPPAVTLIHPNNPTSSFTSANPNNNHASLTNRIVSAAATTPTAGPALGESYDLLDQNDFTPLNHSPRSPASTWMPWSPNSNNQS